MQPHAEDLSDMDEKQTMIQEPNKSQHASNEALKTPVSFYRRRLIVVLILLVTYSVYSISAHYKNRSKPNALPLVPLEAHIITKCPDTRDALRLLVLPTIERVSHMVDFKLSYIGTPTPDGGVGCKHGVPECVGSIIELCARELYPDPKTNLGFIMCLTADYPRIPDRGLLEGCALEHSLDLELLDGCAARDGGLHAVNMLRASFQRSIDLNMTVSCTIRLNEEVYCVRNDGKWVNCPNGPGVDDLVDAIERLHRSATVGQFN